jgi:catechol 2,3-dioxygenase-like lactoylglutathione lyase family enzyme
LRPVVGRNPTGYQQEFPMLGNAALHPVLPASDLERAKRWYSEKLGLEPVEVNDYGDLRFRTGGCEFLVYQSELAGTNKATAAGFRLADVDGAIAALRSEGVVFEDVDFGEFGATVDGVISSPDGKEKSAWFKDSEGNILSLSTSG